MNHVKLVQDKIQIEELVASVTSPRCGAVSTFIGTTRDNFESKKVIMLEYEAYEEMALAEMKKVCNLIRQKWNVEHISIVHRLGVVPVAEASIVIAISSEHRKESLEAIHFAIDTMKATVPIWKKEVYEQIDASEEESKWKTNSECFWIKNSNKNTKTS